ncbi:3-oxo-5-alpha-steroid 4-dehydrogenase, partial [Aureobasidium melanogenum]
MAPPKSAKRKAVSSACIPCRKRKSKCDGGLPSCSTCMAVYRTDCSYDQDTDHRRKGALRKDIASLQNKNTVLDVIINSLCALPEHEATALFHSLRRGERLDSLAEAISGGDTEKLQALVTDLPGPDGTPGATSDTQAPSTRNESSRSPADGKWNDAGSQSAAAEGLSSWFRIPQDAEFVDHLLNLYFCWSHPFFCFFSKSHFLRDMARGSTKYCSALLVNAVCSVACQYSDRPAACERAGDYFFGEAQRLAENISALELTSVQAMAVMAVREGSAGRDHISFRLIGRAVRLAMEMGLHLADTTAGKPNLCSSEMDIRKLTFWGVFNCEMICCLALGRVSSIHKNAVEIDKRSYELRKVGRTVLATLRGRQLASQSERCTAYEMPTVPQHPEERFTPRRLASAYHQYQMWYSELPKMFQLQNTAMPHVIVLHMCYHHLFRPFMKLDLSDIGLYPRELLTYCATEISKLMNALRAMYGLRRTSLAVSSILLSASTVHLMNLPSQGAAVQLTQAMQDLDKMSVNHRYASCCLEAINRLANQWGIRLPEATANLAPFPSPKPDQAMPNMSLFFTQATLSNESPESHVTPPAQSLRHDSCSIFEPSLAAHNMPILPTNSQSSLGVASQHSMHSTPLASYGPTTVYDWVDRLYQIKNGLVIWGWALGNIFHNHDLRDIRRSALHRQREQAKKDNKPIAGIQKLYMMPKNGLPHYILFPHYLCEWIEWVGFWMIGGLNCTPARISLFNEISTMLPRALQGRPWYIQKSGKDKVGNRKAVVSDLI